MRSSRGLKWENETFKLKNFIVRTHVSGEAKQA